jgi:hypothetical protein
MAGGTLGAVADRADWEAAEGLIEVRRRFASKSLTLREGLSEVSVGVDEDEEAVEIGLKDFMWFLFFGMPGDKLRAVCDEVRKRGEKRRNVRR